MRSLPVFLILLAFGDRQRGQTLLSLKASLQKGLSPLNCPL